MPVFEGRYTFILLSTLLRAPCGQHRGDGWHVAPSARTQLRAAWAAHRATRGVRCGTRAHAADGAVAELCSQHLTRCITSTASWSLQFGPTHSDATVSHCNRARNRWQPLWEAREVTWRDVGASTLSLCLRSHRIDALNSILLFEEYYFHRTFETCFQQVILRVIEILDARKKLTQLSGNAELKIESLIIRVVNLCLFSKRLHHWQN